MNLVSYAEKSQYLLSGISRRVRQAKVCPCCETETSLPVDRKLVYTLEECQSCRILYRFPYETADEMSLFYQTGYKQAGMTTDLPSPDQLRVLKAHSFKGTPKDASRIVDVLRALGLKQGRILDYGANWGYTSYQLREAGYDTESFEVSKPRAEFGKQLGIDIANDQNSVGREFDAIYSGHVIEHVPDPKKTLLWMYERVRPGGFVVAHTPNGSLQRRQEDRPGFHKHWGLVHPVLLSDEFIRVLFPRSPIFVSSETNLTELRIWDRQSVKIHSLHGGELFFVIARPKLASRAA